MKRGMESLPQFVHLWHESYKRSLTDTRSFVQAQADYLYCFVLIICWRGGGGYAPFFVLIKMIYEWSLTIIKVLNSSNTRWHLSRIRLFVCVEFIIPLENFSLIWRHHHYRWRAANLTCTRHSWPLSSEGSLACHTFCDTGHPFIKVISKHSWHSHLLQSV